MALSDLTSACLFSLTAFHILCAVLHSCPSCLPSLKYYYVCVACGPQHMLCPLLRTCFLSPSLGFLLILLLSTSVLLPWEIIVGSQQGSCSCCVLPKLPLPWHLTYFIIILCVVVFSPVTISNIFLFLPIIPLVPGRQEVFNKYSLNK